MPAPTFRSNSSFATGTTSVTITLPTGYAAGDILVLNIEAANQGLAQAYTNLTNNGWARPANSNVVVGVAAAANATQTDIWWKRAAASETAVVLGDLGDHTTAVVAAFSNCIASGDPWDGTINVAVSVATAQVNTYRVTTSTANTLVCAFINSPRDAAAVHLNASPVLFNNSDEVEVTERYDFGSTSGGGGTLGLITFRKPTAGTTANLRVNVAVSNTHTIFVGALKAAADARPWSQVIII